MWPEYKWLLTINWQRSIWKLLWPQIHRDNRLWRYLRFQSENWSVKTLHAAQWSDSCLWFVWFVLLSALSGWSLNKQTDIYPLSGCFLIGLLIPNTLQIVGVFHLLNISRSVVPVARIHVSLFIIFQLFKWFFSALRASCSTLTIQSIDFKPWLILLINLNPSDDWIPLQRTPSPTLSEAQLAWFVRQEDADLLASKWLDVPWVLMLRHAKCLLYKWDTFQMEIRTTPNSLCSVTWHSQICASTLSLSQLVCVSLW